MDHLSERAAEAKALGISYGKLVALRHAESASSASEVPESKDRVCVVCGKPIIQSNGRGSYCSQKCRRAAKTQRQRERRARGEE